MNYTTQRIPRGQLISVLKTNLHLQYYLDFDFSNFTEHHHLTITSPSPHRHLTITSPSPHHHLTITSPSPHMDLCHLFVKGRTSICIHFLKNRKNLNKISKFLRLKILSFLSATLLSSRQL